MLSSLTNVNFDFTVNGINFTDSDLDTSDLANVEVVLYGGATNFYFDTNCSGGSGCYESVSSGTLGFIDPTTGDYVSTEPNFYGSTPLNLYEFYNSGEESYALGYYGTPAGLAPEPESLWLLGTGLAAMLVRRFRRA
jgi:hypothetical protein